MKKLLAIAFSALAILGVLGTLDAIAAAYPPALGGTGTTVAPLPGQVLIGNASSNYTPAYILCAGTCTVATSSGGITITGTGVANNSGNWAGTWQLYNPGDFVPSSTAIVNTVNGGSGTVTITSSTLGVVWPTVNGNKATNYNIAAGTGATTTISGATTTISVNLNNGSTQTCSANQFLNSITSAGLVNCGSITFPTPATYTFSAGTGVSLSQATSSSNTTTTITNTGVTSFTGQGCVTSANTTGSVSLAVSCISGNQNIVFTLSGDATGTASGTTAITDSVTVIGLNGKVLPANSTGTLQYSQGAWAINLATSSLGVYDANGKLSSYLGSSCGGGQYVTGFSATGTVACGTPPTGLTYSVAAGTGISTSVATSSSNSTTTVTLNINNGSVQNCIAGQDVNQLSGTGIIACSISVKTLAGVNTSTISVLGAGGSSVATTTNSITITSVSTSTANTWTVLQTFTGLTNNGTTTLASTTNAMLVTDNNGKVSGYAGSNCSAGNAPTGISATGTVQNCTAYLTGNQSVTLTISGDATGTASGATSISDSITVQGLLGKALPSLATGTLEYTGGAWTLAAIPPTYTFAAGAGLSASQATSTSNTTTTYTNTGVTSFNTATGTTSYAVTCTSGCSIASTTTSSAITVTAGGSATTTINNVVGPTFTFTIQATTTGATANTITTSSQNLFLNLLKYTSGTDINVDANGVINFINTPGYINAAGTLTGNVVQSGPNSLIVQNPTSTTSVGNFVQSGGVIPITTSTTLTGGQFLGGGFFDVVSTSTNGTTTITLPTMSQVSASATAMGINIWSSSFSQQFMLNSSTIPAISNTSGTNEIQEYSPGTPTVLSPGQEWMITGQFENSSTVLGATSTGTDLVIKYTLYQTSTLSNTFVFANQYGQLVATSTPSGSGSNNATGTVDNAAYFSGTNTISSTPILYVPADFATVGCAGSALNTTLDKCVNALYASASSTHGVSIWITNDVASSNWTNSINFNINGLIPSLKCTAGVRLVYGGAANATNSVIFNYGNPTGHLTSDDSGCTYMGSSTLLAAGQVNTATTTGILCGGSNGCVGLDFHDNNVNGFGTDFRTGANTYILTLEHNMFSGGNGGQANIGSLLHIPAANNSGERFVVDGNGFFDPGNSSATYAIYCADGCANSMMFTNNSFDDADLYFGVSEAQVTIDHNHFENASPANYAGSPFITASSSGATHLIVTNNLFANDASGTVQNPPEGIEEAVNLVFSNNEVNKYGNQTITNFIDHSINAGQAVETACDDWSQNSAVSNWMQLTGTTYPGCFLESANSYPIIWSTSGSNVATLTNGQQTVMSVDSNGNTKVLGTLNVTSTASLGSTTINGNATTTNLSITTATSSILVTNASGHVQQGSFYNMPTTSTNLSSNPNGYYLSYIPASFVNASYTLGDLLTFPIYFPEAVTIGTSSINVLTAGGTTSTVVTGLYSNVGGMPGALLIQSSSTLVNATGEKNMPMQYSITTPGLYWIAYLNFGSATSAVVQASYDYGFPQPLGSNYLRSALDKYNQNSTTSLVANYTASSSDTGNAPYVQFSVKSIP